MKIRSFVNLCKFVSLNKHHKQTPRSFWYSTRTKSSHACNVIINIIVLTFIVLSIYNLRGVKIGTRLD